MISKEVHYPIANKSDKKAIHPIHISTKDRANNMAKIKAIINKAFLPILFKNQGMLLILLLIYNLD